MKQPAEAVVKDIRRATRRQFSAEEKIRIVLEGLPGEVGTSALSKMVERPANSGGGFPAPGAKGFATSCIKEGYSALRMLPSTAVIAVTRRNIA